MDCSKLVTLCLDMNHAVSANDYVRAHVLSILIIDSALTQ